MDSKEDKLLVSDPKSNQIDQILSVTRKREKSVFSLDDTDHEIQTLSNLSLRKQKESIASLHSKTEALGFINHTCVNSCPCCNKIIPKSYRWNKVLHSSDLILYGIDMINFNSFIKQLFSFVKYFWIIVCILSIISTLINLEGYINHVKYYIDHKLYDFFIIDSFLFYFRKIQWVLASSFLGYFGILVILFHKLHKKISLNKKKHRMNILEKKVIEESLFSVFVKNLPKLTDAEDLKNFIQTEYKVEIREIIMLKDYSVLENLRKKLEELYESGEYSYQIINSINSQIEYYAKNIEQSGAAIIIFENNEDRLLFFRPFFNLREILYMYCKRHFIYRGRSIYFEPVPSLQMINWSNVRYSFEKATSNTKLQYIISFVAVTLLYAVTLFFIFIVSNLSLTTNQVLNSFLKNILLLALNLVTKLSIILLIEAFKVSDNYVKEILKSHFQAQRNTNNTVFINLLKLAVARNETQVAYDILFMIILQNLKLTFLAKFNYNYFYRLISYKLFYIKKTISQDKINDLLGENNFNFMSVFEGFKICFYLAIFVMIISPTLGIVATSMLYLHIIAVRYSLNRSRIKGINTNYYGFYFSYILEKEFLMTGKFFITYAIACFINADVTYYIGANAIGDLVLDLLKMKTYYTKFWVKKSYSEVNFTKKFEHEKFIDIKLYMEDINTKVNNMKYRLEVKEDNMK